MQAFVARRGAFAAAILTITGIAVTSGHAAADDGGAVDDAGQLDGSQDGAGNGGGSDATVVDSGSAGEAAPGDEFDLFTADAGPVQDDGSLPVYAGAANVFQQLCVQDPTVVDPTAKPFSFTTVTAPYTTQADCLKYNDEGHAAAHSCLCNKCFSLMQQCDALQGCREILKCGLDHGCTDPTTCYFASCTTVTDKWANTSIASFLSAKLDGCGCPSQ